MTVVAIASLLIQNTHAQVLQNIAKKAIAKGISEGVNATMKNTTFSMLGTNLTFQASLTGTEWYVYDGSKEFIKVFKDQNTQLKNWIYRGNDYSFDLLIVNDTTIAISHNITRKPHNEQYPLGRKADLFVIKDSVIYIRNFETADSATDYLKGQNTLKGFSPITSFSGGNIYDLLTSKKEDKKIIGSYKYFVPHKANFIFTSIYYKATYGKMSEQLFNEKLNKMDDQRIQWLQKEKECSHCDKKFTGAPVRIKSKESCSTEEVAYSFFSTSHETLPHFCSVKCAERHCIELKR